MTFEIMISNPWLIIAAMTITTLATRWGSVFLMSVVPISNRVPRFIQALSATVLVPLLSTLTLTGT